MSQPKTRKRIYTILGLLALLYTIVGTFVTCTSNFDYLPGAEYDIRRDSMALGIIVLFTGVPLFLLFVFLERRTKL